MFRPPNIFNYIHSYKQIAMTQAWLQKTLKHKTSKIQAR